MHFHIPPIGKINSKSLALKNSLPSAALSPDEDQNEHDIFNFGTINAPSNSSKMTRRKPDEFPMHTINIAQQAIDDLDKSSRVWESDFESWGVKWRQMINTMQFERVRDAAYTQLLHRTDPEIESLVLPPANVYAHSTIKGDADHSSINSMHEDYVHSYQHYTTSQQSFDLTENATTPQVDDAEAQVSIVEDDNAYQDLAREIPDSKSSDQTELHVYRQLLY